MQFLMLDRADFEYGVAAEVCPGVRRVIARNPSKFTYHGTGTYIVGDGPVAVVDPGPALDQHRDALANALEGHDVAAILVTHCHADHSPLAEWLKSETGAPTYAFGPHAATTESWDLGSLPDEFGVVPDDQVDDDGGLDIDEPEGMPKMEESTDLGFVPDVEVRTGDEVTFGTGDVSTVVRATHTPGHTSNHTCFSASVGSAPTGTAPVLFPGDHVMGWSTTVVSPPDGDMAAYIDSLRRVAEMEHSVALPTHGPPITDPSGFISGLVEHRLDRERQVLGAIERGLVTIPDMVTELYAAVRVALHRPAAFSVLGHLVKLVDEERVTTHDGGKARLDATYSLA
ncbi:MAG: MBL fold metallo-hydrolase [Actinomycetota bacterium]